MLKPAAHRQFPSSVSASPMHASAAPPKRAPLKNVLNAALHVGGADDERVTLAELKAIVKEAGKDGKIGQADQWVIACFVGAVNDRQLNDDAAEYFNGLVDDGTLIPCLAKDGDHVLDLPWDLTSQELVHLALSCDRKATVEG